MCQFQFSPLCRKLILLECFAADPTDTTGFLSRDELACLAARRSSATFQRYYGPEFISGRFKNGLISAVLGSSIFNRAISSKTLISSALTERYAMNGWTKTFLKTLRRCKTKQQNGSGLIIMTDLIWL